MAINCNIDIPKIDGLKDNELSVGREFTLGCVGEFPKNINPQKLHFILPEESKYAIKLIKANFESESKAAFVVTSYVAAEVRIPDLQVTDDSQVFSLGPVEFKVQTMIPPPPKPEPGQQPAKQEPYGPIGPASIPIPHIYFVILLAVIGAAVALLVFKILRVVQRRNMVERLKEHNSAMTPIAEFHSSMRKLQRVNPAFFAGQTSPEDISAAMAELNRMTRLYLTRKYQIPALEWSPRVIAKDIKKYQRKVYVESGTDLIALMREFEHASGNTQKVIGSDIVNLSKRTRQLVELMESLS